MPPWHVAGQLYFTATKNVKSADAEEFLKLN
jgi:hypothetical protein